MQTAEQARDHANQQRAARMKRDLFGVPQKQNLYPTLIGRSILERTGLLESPTQIFEKCLEILANAKKNLQEQRDAYFNYLEKGVDNLIEAINENLMQDIDEKIYAVVAKIFRHDAKAKQDLANQQSSGISSDKDVSFVQASLDMIETFQKIAQKHGISKISKDLLDVFNRVVQDSIEVYKMHSSAISQQLQFISSESEILEATHFKWRFQQIVYIRQVHQISAKTNEEFQNMQMKIQKEVQTHKTKIRRHLLKLQKPGEHFHKSVEEDIMYEELDQSAQVIRYFGSLLDPDQGTIEYIKSQLKKEFEKIIKNFDTKASLKSLNHPRNWKNIDHVGHMLEEYRHIMRVVNSLELQISQGCALTDSIKLVVEEALKVIQDAVKTPKLFMTTKDYNDYSTYLMYLKLAIKNQEIYLPTPELLALAFKLQQWVEDSVMKQYLQLKEVFNYRYSRYLLKEGKDQNHIFLARPDPIFYDDEEEKKVEKDKDSVNNQESETQKLEDPENDDWQGRLKESCQEVINVAQVLTYLLKKQLNQSMKNSQLPICQLLSPLLEKENLLDLFGHFRKRLLHDYYDGLNLQELWIQHLQEKPFQSLFFYRQQALSALKVVDISLGIKDLRDIVEYIRVEENQSSPTAYQSDIEENRLALKTMEKETMTYQTIEEAYHAFKNRELPTLESLYDQGLYKEVLTQLEGIQKTESNMQRMSKYIQNDMEQTLLTIEWNIKDFKIVRGALGEQDGDNLENLIQGTSMSIRRVDLVIQILGDYMIKDQNIKKLEEVLGIIRETFKSLFEEIKTLGESDISSALMQLYQTEIIIKKIQHQPKEPDSQSQFAPQSQSLLTLIQQLQILEGNCKIALEELVRSTIKKFEGADLETGFSKITLYPKQFFDPLAQLNDKIKGDTISKGVSKHLGETIQKFDEKLSVVKPEEEEVNTKEGRNKALNTLGALRLSALCQADSVSSVIVLKIDNLIEQINIQWEIMNLIELNILEAIQKDSPFEIAEILDHRDIKPQIKDETLIKVQQKFSEKILGLISEAVKKFGNGQTKANLKGLIEGDIPNIQSFFDHRSLYNKEKPDEGYIVDFCRQQFKSQVIDQVSSIGCYAILYVQKQILAPRETLDRFDEDLIKARKDLKVQIGSFDKALSTLLDINSANTTLIFDGIKDKLASFYSAATQWITSTVEKWHQSIKAGNSQAMIGLADDLGMNDLNFKEKNFIKALQAEEETDANYLFVRALKNQFYAAENNQRLIQWALALKDKIISMNFLDMNEKLIKDDRVTFYKDVETLYIMLASVARKVGEYYYFSDALSQMETEVLEKIVDKVDQLCIMQKASHNVLEDRSNTLNILERKDAQAKHKIFMLIKESFDNLETLKDTLSILGRKERESINEAQQDFKDKLFGRVAWLKMKSNELQEQSDDPIKVEPLKEVAKILLEMQILKVNFIIFKGQLQEAQDQILDEYDTIQLQKRNRLRMENLRRMIQGQDLGTSIIGECRVFAGDNMKELAKKLATKSVGIVLKQMTGDDTLLLNDTLSQESNMVGDDDSYLNGDDENHLPPVGTKEFFQQQPKILLRQMFAKFNLRYQELLKKETAATFEKGIIVQHTPDRVIAAIKSFQLSQRQWVESDIQKLPELLALIFGLWSLQKPEHLLRKQQQDKDLQSHGPGDKSKEDELFYYLNQPHPAQVEGIFRILGAGYNPNEFVKFGEGDTSKAKTFGNSPQALQARIRNNLVQIITGQGKSVTLAVLSIIFALCGFDVHCACYSNYLSERDFQAFLSMFTQLELKDRIKYGTFDKLCEMEINKDGNLRDIVSNLILENPENKISIMRDADPRPQVLLIDEVDVFFQDDFFGNSYMPRQLIKGPFISALTDMIWYYCDRKMSFEQVQETDEYKQACQMFKPEFLFLLEEAVKRMLHDVKGIESYDKGKLIGGKIQYKVGDGWSDNATDGYKTLFAYYYYYHRDASNPGRDSITLDTLNDKKAIGVNCTEFSYAEGPLSYPLILGLTGTLDTLSTEQLKIMKSVYNLSSKTYAPSAYDIPKVDPEEQKKHGPSPQNKIEGLVDEILIMNEAQDQMYPDQTNTDEVHYVNEMTIKILETEKEWFNFIDHRIEEGLRTKNTKEGVEGERAVIVFFENDVILKEYKKQSTFIKSYDSSKVDVLTEKDDKDVKASKVSNATNQGHITLLTREFGRGTDFKYQGDLVINAGGLLVIQTFYTKDYSEEIQIRGRTRRQGTTGSYELIVQLSDLQGVFDKEFVASIMEVEQNPKERYKALHCKRQELFEVAQKNKLQKREGLKVLHYAYAKNVENIKRILEKCPVTVSDDEKQGIRQMLWDLNCFIAKGPDGQPELNLVKALVLIDATHSMNDLLTNAKNIIQLYFDTVCKSLADAKYSNKIFKLQMAFYRNYSSGMKILEHSEWTGPEEVQALKTFLETVIATGGQGCEAMEIGLLHCNREIYEPADGVPVSLIYVIGDAPANPNLEVVNQNKKSKNKQGKNAWGKDEEKAFGESTTWDEQLERIKNHLGAKIPIYSFYLKSTTFENKINQVEQFFTKIRINNEPDDDGGLLDVNDKDKLAKVFCKYTMRMIAKKNPYSGDKQKLIHDSENLTFTRP